MMELGGMRQAGHVARMGQVKYSHTFFVGKTEGKLDVQGIDVDGRMASLHPTLRSVRRNAALN
jgi:hypothetical protein